jgi:hypothetical protein
MIIRWGRKGLYAGAFAFAFIAAPVTTNNVQIHKLNEGYQGQFDFYYLTPESAGATSIRRHHIFPDFHFNFKHLTPVAAEPEPGSAGGNYARTIGYYPEDKLYYEKRIREALKRAEKEREKEKQLLLEKLAFIEDLRAEAKKEQILELELQVLVIKEALFHVEQELARIEEKRADIVRLAKILKDDEEVLVILS